MKLVVDGVRAERVRVDDDGTEVWHLWNVPGEPEPHEEVRRHMERLRARGSLRKSRTPTPQCHELCFAEGAWRLASEWHHGEGQTGMDPNPLRADIDAWVIVWGRKLAMARSCA